MSRSVFNRLAAGVVVLPIIATTSACVSSDITGSITASNHSQAKASKASIDAFRILPRGSRILGNIIFCNKNPGECGSNSRYHQRTDFGTINSEQWQTIHVKTMQAIEQENDSEIYGENEVWAFPDNGEGDCEDIQLKNRRDVLETYGIHPATTMFILIKEKADSKVGHVVQAAYTKDEGWMVSDNLEKAHTYKLSELYVKYASVLKVTFDLDRWFAVEKVEKTHIVSAQADQAPALSQ